MENERSLAEYVPGTVVRVNDKMQKGYSYTLEAPVGKDFDEKFEPYLTPQQMLEMGVFEGKYLNDCRGEYPREWYARAKTSQRADPRQNCFGVKSRQSLQEWRRKGWIPLVQGDPDVRGWFQWYCRYYLGRRNPAIDKIQIARWRSFARHRGQVLASYKRMERPPTTIGEKLKHRPRQRQALLQWAYNPWV